MVSDRSVQRLVNNQLAQSGAREGALRGQDRAGISRGKGQQYAAEAAGAIQESENYAAARGTELAAQQANADSRQQYDFMRDQERVANRGLLNDLMMTDAAERLGRRGNNLDLFGTQLQGQFGLDSIRLDRTPLLRALLRS